MIEITWLGHATFQLKGEKTVVIDPFLSDNPACPKAVEEVAADVVYVTHDHFDHIADAGALCKRTGATLVSVFEIATEMAEEHGIKSEPANVGGTVHVDGVTCHLVPAWHTAGRGGTPTGVVIEMEGKRIYHAGDTSLFGDMAMIGDFFKPDVFFVPIGDRFTMGPESAARAVAMVKPRVVIPMHYNTWPPIEQDPQRFAAFVRTECPDIVVEVLEPGATFELEQATDPPGPPAVPHPAAAAYYPPVDDWLRPRQLYAKGFPSGLTSALKAFGVIRTRLREIVASLDATCILEVGPGDRPVTDPGPGCCYLDISHHILTHLEGVRVEADIVQAPFSDGMFDLVVAADVFTHIPSTRWRDALREMVRVAPQVVLFNPEPGAQKYHAAPVESKTLRTMLEEMGLRTMLWPVDIGNDQGGRYRFGLILAVADE